MIIDTSAVVTIVREQTDARRCLQAILGSPERRISAGNLLEAYIVVDSATSAIHSRKLDAMLVDLRMIIEPVTRDHVDIARDAYRRFGKGSGSQARLNYGDCFAYALATFRNEPLLFIGNDFDHTDIDAVL